MNIIRQGKKGTGNPELDQEPITNKFIRDEYQWDRMGEVDWGMIEHNLVCAENILANPEKFPKANFDYLETKVFEHEIFLLGRHGRVC